MLTRLLIENLTVFERVEAELDGMGLVCITGETGAGKTMLLQAMRLIAGAKSESSLIGPAGNEAYVEATFSGLVPKALTELATDGEELILARRLRKEGPARALCNGRGASASQLAEAAGELISLTGQHAARQLVSPAFQLELLDSAGGLGSEVEAIALAYSSHRQAAAELQNLRESMRDRERRFEMLRHEQELYGGLDPQPGESDLLHSERDRLRHAESLAETAVTLHEGLAVAEGSVIECLDVLEADARRAAEHDKQFLGLADALLDQRERLADVATAARDLRSGYEADPERLLEVEERLAAFAELRRRFGGAELEEIAAQMEDSAAELATLEDADAELARLASIAEEAEAAYEKAAGTLSKKRRKAATELRRAVETHLAELALPEAELEIAIAPAKPSARGSDNVEFLLRANRGLEATPLGKGASGGELSRVNLALALVASEGSSHSCYLFDEVDAGIGGQTAHAVASKLAALAETAQVIVITHLAQIAVQAQSHYVVEKQSAGERTVTELRRLTSDGERQAELARLAGADGASGEEVERLVRAGADA